MLPSQPNQSVIDAMTCLQTLVAQGGAVGNRELARQMGLNITRVNRLLKTMAHVGMVRQTPQRKYLPGPGMHVLTALALGGDPLLTAGVPLLETELRTLPSAQMLAFGMLWQRHVAYLFFAHGGDSGLRQGDTVALRSRSIFPAIRSSIGRVLLAHEEPAYLDRFFTATDELVPFATRQELDLELETIRSQRFAYVPAAQTGSEGSVAIPVGADSERPYAGVAIAGVEGVEVVAVVERLRSLATRLNTAIAEASKPRPAGK
jgi:DNA-binding IclR family transcriptional regulator